MCKRERALMNRRGRGPGLVTTAALSLLLGGLSGGAVPDEGTGTTPHSEHRHAQGHAEDGDTRPAAPAGMAIEIESPVDGATFPAGEPVPVRVRTAGMSPSGDHWHLYVDGELQAMVGAGRVSYELSAAAMLPGTHELRVTISNLSHEEYDIEHGLTIRILEPGAGAGEGG